MTNIRNLALGSVKWAVLGNVFPKLLQLATTLVLARLLVPNDFGIMSVASLAIGLAGMIQALGLTQALVQTDQDIKSAANGIFWINLMVAALMSVTLWALAPTIAAFFSEPQATAPLRVMCLMLIIGALDDVQEALLSREFQFQKLLWQRVSPPIASLVVSIPLAALGFGFWGLIAGVLAGSALGAFVLWRISPWRPTLAVDFGPAKTLLPFGLLVTVEGLQGWVLISGDNLVVGKFLGIDDLGVYHLGFTLAVTSMGYAVNPLLSVAYPAFSRLRTDAAELRVSFFDSVRFLALVTAPACVGLAFTAGHTIPIFLGQKWYPLIPVLQILAVMPGLSWILALNPQLYRAVGRPDLMPKFHLATLLYVVPVYLLAVRFGLIPFCLARASVSLVFLYPHVKLACVILGARVGEFWEAVRAPVYGTFVMVICLSGFRLLLAKSGVNAPTILCLASEVLLGILTYGVAVRHLDSSLFQRAVSLSTRVFR